MAALVWLRDELQDLALARGERFVHVLTCRRALRVGFDARSESGD